MFRQAEEGIGDFCMSRGLGVVYRRKFLESLRESWRVLESLVMRESCHVGGGGGVSGVAGTAWLGITGWTSATSGGKNSGAP